MRVASQRTARPEGQPMTGRKARAVWLMALLSAPAWSAAAQEQAAGFRSPSNNIHCAAFKQDDGAVLRCDIAKMANKPPPKPKDCELDWGSAFEMTDSSQADRICHGDTAQDPSLPVLAYGAAWQRHGFTCKSEANGVTCTNAKGRGFELSRGRQRLF